jgi:hypothetical protein
MARTAAQAGQRLIALALPGISESVPVARLRVRAALGSDGLGEYADDAEIITSELVTNAVSDSCPHGPIGRDALPGSEQGRGLQSVEALSTHWGWRREDAGKTVFAVLAREA